MSKKVFKHPKHWQLPSYQLFEFKKKKFTYCVVIPVLNEGKKIQKQLTQMRRFTKVVDIILADGDSKDGALNRTFLRSAGVRSLLIKKDVGKQATQLRMAFAYAIGEGYKGIIQVDGNNKDGIEAIPKFIQALQEGYDYVQGSRFIKGGKAINTPPVRWIGIRFITSPILSFAAKYWYTDVTNGFRAYSRKYLLHSEVKPFRNIFDSYALNFYLCVRAKQLGLKTKEIPVSRIYPKGKVPTKMSSIKGQLGLLQEVVKTARGRYHPKH